MIGMLWVSKARAIEAPPERVFAYLADVGQHADLRSVVRVSANGNIAKGTQGGLSGEVRGHTEESDDFIPVGNH